MNQNPWGDEGQRHAYSEATKLAAYGKEYFHLVALLSPNYAMRLRCFVADLPEEVRNKTIYGRTIALSTPTAKRRKG